MSHWRGSYDFTCPSDDNELDSSDDSDSDAAIEAPKLYHRRKSTAATVRARHCLKEGHLLKQSGSFQRWKKRYFKLREGKKLFYAKNNNQNTIFNEIDLQDVSIAETSIRNVNNSFTLITPYRSLVLSAESRREMEEWFGCLRALCSKRSSQSDILDQLSGTHNWYSCTHTRPTFCNVCKDILSGVTSKGLSCEVCRFKVHRRCAAKAANNCKWTTIQSLRREALEFDESDPMSMPHQWLEGNLVPGSRCSVCDRQCGSKRRLQDFRCLWCNATVHTSCKSTLTTKCTFGENCLSILSPLCLEGPMGPGRLEKFKYTGLSPLLVFVNSKSGDNQGVKFIRKFKQLVNPIQVFDLGVGGPQQGIQIFKQFNRFRILVCGGDGSIGWVMKEVDNTNLTNKVQIGVLPLGTGNDLSRVLGWGTSFADDSALPQFLQHLERAKALMLDRWSIMSQECNPTVPPSRSPSIETLDEPPPYQQEFDKMDIFENNVATHLTRILHSSQHQTVITSAKVLCEIVKDFVSKVGAASATSDPEEANDPGSLPQKCEVLNEKLNLLLKTLSIESEATPMPAKEDLAIESSDSNPMNNNAKTQKVFVPKDALMSRANSLKKALRQIIEHTETEVDKQNAQTCNSTSSLAEAMVTAATEAASDVVTMSSSSMLESVPENTVDQSLEQEPTTDNDGNLIESPTNETTVDLQAVSNILSASLPKSSDARFLSRGSSYPCQYEPSFEDLLTKQSTKPTVQFNSCIISKGFLKDRPKESIVGLMIGKALLANADALCAPATPMMNTISDVDGYSERCMMNNYFGIGLDAKISLEFHNRREEHPEKYRSRKKNMIWYGFLGGKEFVQRTYKNLDQCVKLECDGHRISLPSLQGILVLNITSYMGGANFWGGSRDDGFSQPSFDDSLLEVIAVLGAQQMGMSKVFGGMQHHRIAQCRVVKITITGEPIPVQVDGEAWMQTPGYIKIVHKNRAQMLVRDRNFENTLKLWTDLQQEKNALTSDFESETLKSLAVAVLPLVQSVQRASEQNPAVEKDLSDWAKTIERLLPDRKSQENISRTRAMDFLSNAKAFTQEVIWFLNEKLQSMVPPLSEDCLTSITIALNTLQPELIKAMDVCGLADFEDESFYFQKDRSQASKGKSKFSFGWRSKKPEMTKAVTAPAGRMIQYWGVEEVGRWLDNIGLGEYRELFAKHEVCGSELLSLTRAELKEFGVTKVAHIKRILHGVKQLCGGLSSRTAARIERTARCEEKSSKSPYYDKEYSH